MSLPVYRVEIAFSTLPDDPSPAWVDVSAYVLYASGIGVQRGRADEFEAIGPSSMSLRLNNTDGRFSPDNPDGAYYPNVKKGRLIRVIAGDGGYGSRSYGGGPYGGYAPRFTGYVASWEPTWPGGNSASSYVDIRAMSRMAGLARGSELRDIISCEYDLDSPAAHFTLGEPTGSAQIYDTSGTNASVLSSRYCVNGAAATLGTSTGPGTDGLTAATINGGQFWVFDPSATFTTAATVEAFITTTDTNFRGVAAIGQQSTAGNRVLSIASEGGGLARAAFIDSTGTYIIDGGSGVNDGNVHHLAATVTSGGTLRLYVDGVQVASSATGATGTFSPTRLYIGGQPVGTESTTAGFFGGLSHVAVYSAVLSAARIADHAAAGLTGFAGEGSGARIARLAAYAGIPAAAVSAETGSATGLPFRDTTGRTPLDMMQEVTTTENGTLFDGKDGVLTFQGRDHRYGATSVATFAPATDLAPVLDDFGMANEVTATGDGGISAYLKDQASIGEHGNYGVTLELMTTSDDDVYQAAAWRLATSANPVTRIPTATANIHGLGVASQDAVLSVEIGDRITLTNLPDQAPAPTMDFFVEGYSEQMDPTSHVWTANLTPAWVYDVWVLGDTTRSVLGTSTRLGL
jgi:hypothetical protein